MKGLLVFALVVAGCANGERSGGVRVPLVPPKQIVDATHLQRRSADDIEVVVLSQSGGSSLMTFQLNRRPIARVRQGEAILLYLSPARYRFGIIPYSHAALYSLSEITVDLTQNAPQIYRIFQSSGFTSSGGNAVFEIAPVPSGKVARSD